jgi:ferric-dicitrate binding protein FerR (iron transport regulator)
MGNHTVRLTGEALFTVTHHDGAPLTVIAGPVTARVLGTDFLVRHYTSDTVATVAVRNGKVSVGQTILTAQQQLTMNAAGVPRLQPVSAGVFGFTTGVLTLNVIPLPEAIVELDRWYDVDIRIGDAELATQGIGGRFTAGSLVDLTTILELTLPVRVVREGRVLTLYAKTK